MEKAVQRAETDQKGGRVTATATLSDFIGGKGKSPVCVEVNESGESTLSLDGIAGMDPIENYKHHMRNLTATKDNALAHEIVQRAAYAMPKNNTNIDNLVVAAQTLSDMEPKDSVEAKLCLQSSTLYATGMQYLRRAEDETRIVQSEFYIKNAVKLLRLHNETIEALSRYKRKGEQRVVVQHVNIEGGGQAVVGGTVIAGGGGK
jgi:hypothetical protein